MRMSPEYNICEISMLNKVLGINIVKASDIINTNEKMKEIKKKVKRLFLKNIIKKIKLINKLKSVVKIVELLFMLNIVNNNDLHDKKHNCLKIG